MVRLVFEKVLVFYYYDVLCWFLNCGINFKVGGKLNLWSFGIVGFILVLILFYFWIIFIVFL